MSRPEVTSRRLVTTAATAIQTGLSASTLNKMRLTGEGPPFVKLGASVRYDPELVDQWIEKRIRHSTSEVEAA